MRILGIKFFSIKTIIFINSVIGALTIIINYKLIAYFIQCPVRNDIYPFDIEHSFIYSAVAKNAPMRKFRASEAIMRGMTFKAKFLGLLYNLKVVVANETDY